MQWRTFTSFPPESTTSFSALTHGRFSQHCSSWGPSGVAWRKVSLSFLRHTLCDFLRQQRQELQSENSRKQISEYIHRMPWCAFSSFSPKATAISTGASCGVGIHQIPDVLFLQRGALSFLHHALCGFLIDSKSKN